MTIWTARHAPQSRPAVVVYVLATSDTEDGDPQTAARRGELLSGILTQDEEIWS